MTAPTTTVSGLSGPDIRAVLAQHARDELPAFEREFRDALEFAGRTFDVSRIEDVLLRWWGLAQVRSVRLSPGEVEQVARARTGDDARLLMRTEDGTFTRVG